MPGISFLFKKKFHPVRIDNQKRVFLAEESKKAQKDKEDESAAEVRKERELIYYENLGKAPERDPRSSSLKFMYSMPKSKGNEDTESKPSSQTKHRYDIEIDENGEDEMVKLFKQKVENKMGDASNKSHSSELVLHETPLPEEISANSLENPSDKHKGSSRNMTYQEQIERHPRLKNAPTEGEFTKSTQLHHKPFNDVIRNVKCARCGQWGHRSGERECVLKDYNPLDYQRQKREDPMAHSAFTSSSSDWPLGIDLSLLHDSTDAELDELETQLLNSLSRREKKILLARLKCIDSGEPYRPRSNSSSDSSSSSNSSSSSTSDSSSDSDSSRSRSSDRGQRNSDKTEGEKKGSLKAHKVHKKDKKRNARHKSHKSHKDSHKRKRSS